MRIAEWTHPAWTSIVLPGWWALQFKQGPIHGFGETALLQPSILWQRLQATSRKKHTTQQANYPMPISVHYSLKWWKLKENLFKKKAKKPTKPPLICIKILKYSVQWECLWSNLWFMSKGFKSDELDCSFLWTTHHCPLVADRSQITLTNLKMFSRLKNEITRFFFLNYRSIAVVFFLVVHSI